MTNMSMNMGHQQQAQFMAQQQQQQQMRANMANTSMSMHGNTELSDTKQSLTNTYNSTLGGGPVPLVGSYVNVNGQNIQQVGHPYGPGNTPQVPGQISYAPVKVESFNHQGQPSGQADTIYSSITPPPQSVQKLPPGSVHVVAGMVGTQSNPNTHHNPELTSPLLRGINGQGIGQQFEFG